MAAAQYDQAIQPVVMSPIIYSLSEFTNYVFNPQVRGFSFSDVGSLLASAGLRLVGWEFPELLPEDILNCKETTGDEEIRDFAQLDRYIQSHPNAFRNSNNVISFTAEKP